MNYVLGLALDGLLPTRRPDELSARMRCPEDGGVIVAAQQHELSS